MLLYYYVGTGVYPKGTDNDNDNDNDNEKDFIKHKDSL